MATFFGAIADDFTGATDLAGLLARSGVPVSLRIGVPAEPPQNTAPLEIIALKCRTSPVDEAVQETQAALQWLKDAGAQRFFWKYCSTFDSTAKGNIGPVAEALMESLGVSQTIYCPAFPENGRAIFMGNLFVGEQPLSESPMKDHPLTPMRDSNLARLLGPQVTKPVGLANRLSVAKGAAFLADRLSRLASQGVAHVVVDAVANDDLYIIAEACQDMVLLTGGSAVAMPLPELWAKQGRIERSAASGSRSFDPGPAIVLSGSCSAMTNRQVAEFLSKGGPSFRLDPLEIAETGNAKVLNWLAAQDSSVTPLIYATAAPDSVRVAQERLGVDRAGSLIEQTLAVCAEEARNNGYRRFVVAGGETSGSVIKALSVSRLNIGAEIAPGVPWCFATSQKARIAVTLKSGNFGSEEFFSRALEVLDQ
ncbi:3-oxo-tetronate kinase [Rhizobium leguminosarum]|uniref:3-oxo-tetronate kinase n=1 Tax=Rhizobium leguminosarum TaxID=384 RepID=A0A2K9Z6S8_RHILE|nr:3-oxo-tetronate kinase [Rhizobium leguminosarum]AUW43933.1 hypothetical protein CUJ84_Chr003598 [Rhizobium leguminosarum]